MAEASQLTFSFKEVVEALVRKQDLHEGIWGLNVNFGLQATSMGPTESDLKPVGILAIVSIGLQRQEKETNLSVDAAKVNPPLLKPKPKHAN
jgi:hypothetical protein